MRKHGCFLLILLGALSADVPAQDTQYPPQGEQIPGPDYATTAPCCFHSQELKDPKEAFHAWIEDVRHWRNERRIRIGYDGSQYERPELRWTQSSLIQPQMMIEDRYFYDPVAGRYTVDRYLDDLEKRYGGIDSVLVWHTYPNIGIDNRNQYDLLHDMPGGVAGLRQMIQDFHRRGVRVLFPVMLWDQGTRDVGMPNWEATARAMAEIGADGINGDTLDGVPRAFRLASDATGHPLALEPEGGPADEAIQWNNLSWGYWKYPFVPMISRYKWLEPRHMVNVCDRWNRDKTNNLQYAFFNGVGYESWENIWGIWNQITPRDAEALRRVSKIERAFAALLVSPDWEPHTPTLRYGLFASRFPGRGQTLWTLVNRNPYDLAGRQIEVPYVNGWHYYDLWHGEELRPEFGEGKATLSFEVEGNGFGALLAVEGAPPANLASLLAEMHELSRTPLKSLSHEWKFLPQQMVEIAPTRPAASAPEGMVKIPETDYEFRTAGIMIEGGNEVGVDVQFPWEDAPRRYHLHKMHIRTFYIDKFPVTNAEFKKFLDATRYHPRDNHNFLKDWKGGTYPEGWEKKPVTWVSLEDARAYAAWAGKRLPHEWEWQYAAQGTDGRLYPWGNEWDASRVPPPDKRREMREPTDVDAYPKGASPFGVMDLVGNVWQWTDEFTDEHTRAAILKGGNYYQPQGSLWYFPEAYKLTEHGKYLLIAPSKDRSGTVGFRCVADTR
ncbi:MAG TPA: formylglycine-generating enzyme family protein [Terriglobia bacterium]|jgi:formylglycine-generating enzyme required for sulfatase activity|nr:formylglycine-generating enzyme family protein [Terriglobia bacterium]